MSGLIPITVNTPPGEEAHIHAEDDASVYLSLFGGDGVSTNGQSCKATVLSNNKVRIADGIICVGGHFARIPYGDYIDCEIDSGQSGKNRNDIIVARIKTTGTGGIDTYTCEVKKGTAGSTATDPEIVQEDLYKAGKVRELPLYRVKIEGLSITAVEQLFMLRKTNEELEKELESLNSKTENILQFKAFTKVARVSGSSSVQIITLADLQVIFPNATDKNSGAFVMNGDGVSTDAHFDGVVWKSGTLYATFNKVINTQIRITGFVYYSPQEVPQW